MLGNDPSDVSLYELGDKDGNMVKRALKEGTTDQYVYYLEVKIEDGKELATPVNKPLEMKNGEFFFVDTGEKVELTSAPALAKINLAARTMLTGDMFQRSDEIITNDVRKMEYSVIGLPTQIETDKYIDIRLRMPNGGDYIVVSHKKIEIPEVDGVPSSNTLWVNLSEDEILTMSCAIVESYQIQGSRLYATEYVEPGSQKAAVKTYIPNAEICKLVVGDPNCVEEAKQALADMYNDNEKRQIFRDPIQNNVNNNSEDATDSVIEKTQEEIQKTQQERQSYLESLGGGN